MTVEEPIDDFQLSEWLKRDDSETLNRLRLHRLIAEVRRLRGLVKAAEWADEAPGCCTWCGGPFGDRGAHTAECPAFHEDGRVR